MLSPGDVAEAARAARRILPDGVGFMCIDHGFDGDDAPDPLRVRREQGGEECSMVIAALEDGRWRIYLGGELACGLGRVLQPITFARSLCVEELVGLIELAAYVILYRLRASSAIFN